jgi:DNA mismatch endonuclease (patch repair protein)
MLYCIAKGKGYAMGRSPMTDDPVRSYTMSRIRSKNTSIELSLRRALWASGIRYRKNYRKLPGTPDIAITKHGIAVFCDGDFWHGRDWATVKRKLKSNREYWVEKIERNIRRDRETNNRLCSMGWTVVRFWGSDIRRDLPGCVEDIKDVIFMNTIEKRFRYDSFFEEDDIWENR